MVKGGTPGSKWSRMTPEERTAYYESRKEYNKEWRAAKKWNMTLEEYESYLPDDGLCPICRTTPKVWALDHDHNTGAIRGMLCKACNVGVGSLRDSVENLERAILWLKQFA
jgi:hypothetical protein